MPSMCFWAGLAPLEPASTKRHFNVYRSDVGQIVFLPRLLSFMERETPQARLRVCPISLDDPGALLASGEVDLAAGYCAEVAST